MAQISSNTALHGATHSLLYTILLFSCLFLSKHVVMLIAVVYLAVWFRDFVTVFFSWGVHVNARVLFRAVDSPYLVGDPQVG